MAIDVLETPVAPIQSRVRNGTPVHERGLPPRPETYKLSVHKMEVLNNGENDQDRAVQFQLKEGQEGTQGFTFVLGIDQSDPKRVLNIDSLEQVGAMTEDDYSHTAILQQMGNNLSVLTPDKQEVRLTKEGLKNQPYRVKLNSQTVVEILDFDPDENSIVLHKANDEPLLPPIVPIAPIPPINIPWWRNLINKTVIPVTVATALTVGGIPEFPPPPVPPPTIERQIETQIPEALQCPATKEMTVGEGDSLTSLIIEVNGLSNYLTDKGDLDVDKLYGQLACMVAIKRNRDELANSDELAAGALDTMFVRRTTVGPLTAKRIYENLRDLNTKGGKERFKGASEQLAIIQPGQVYLVPFYGTQETPQKIS